MNFCYFHPDTEASGQCTNCENWICSKDYHLVKKEIGVRKEVATGKNNSVFFRSRNRSRQVNKIETAPVIYCPTCYEREIGLEPDLRSFPAEKVFIQPKKLLMCFQCGEKLLDGDKFCPNCGDSTEDETYDAIHQIKGVQASKKLK